MSAQHNTAYRARIVGTMHGSTTNNVLHFRSSTASPLDPGEINRLLQALATAIFECVIETLLPAVTNEWTFQRVEVQIIGPITSDVIEATANANANGNRTETNVSFASSLVNLRSGQGGRRGRGKLFLPPGGDADMTQSVLSGDLEDLLEAFILCLFGKFVGASKTTEFEWCVFSKTDLGLGVFTTHFQAMRPIVNAAPNRRVAILGRRKLGTGS